MRNTQIFFYLRQILGIQNSSLQLRRNIYYKKKLNLGTEFTQTTESYKYGKHKLPLF